MAYRNTPYHVNFNGGFSGYSNPGGRVYYVGASAAADGISPSDSNSGTSPQQAFSTIQKGLDSCTSGRGDAVLVLPGSYTVTAPLTMTSDDVVLTTSRPVGPHQYGPVIITAAATYDNNLIQMDANNITVEGFVFECGFTTVTANQEVIQMNSTNTTTDNWGQTVRNCYLDGTRSAGAASTIDTDLDGIRVGLDANDRVYGAIIEGCVIRSFDQDGVAVTASTVSTVIRNCLIYDGVGSELMRYGVNAAGAGTQVLNCFITNADTATPGAPVYVNSTLARIHNNNLWARGADGTCILVAASGTVSSSGNFLTAVAAGNLDDYLTDNTTPSADCNFSGIFAATPGIAVLNTPTVAGI